MSMSMMRRLGLCVAAIVLLTASSAQAQRAGVRGAVVDPDGRPAPNATVLVSDQAVVRRTAVTDSQGRFHVENLTAGHYELRVVMAGFAATPTTVALSPDQTQSVTLALRVSAIGESVVVTAAGRELPRSRVTDSVTVVTADDIAARQFETVADALRFSVPGLGVTATGGRGEQTALFTRGGESDFTLVMIDGVRVNGFGGAFDFAHLPVGDIERIEVVRGPQSAVYGSDAIGGVVQIITKQGGPARVGGVFEGGTFGTSRVAVNTAGSVGSVAWGAAFEQLDTDGQNGETSQAGETVSNDDYTRRDVSLHGQWRGERGTTVRSVFRYGTNERGFPGPWGSDPGGTYGGIDTLSRGTNDNRLVSIGVSQRLGARVDQGLDVSHTQADSVFNGPFGRADSDATRLTVRARTDATLREGIVATTGFDVQQEQAGSTFITDASFTEIPVDRRMLGFFGELRFDPTSRLSLTAGIRGDRITREGLAGDGFGRPTFGNETEVAANPKVSLGWYLRPAEATPDWTRLRVSAGTGIRPPNAFEIAFTDNPALKSERTRSVDVGLEQALARGRVLVEATAFFNRYDDLIVSVGQSFQNASQFRTDNLSNSQARGLELAATGRTPQGFEARATYTWLHTEILALDSTGAEAPGGFSVGDALLRRPRHQGSVELSFTQPVFSVFTSIGTRSATRDIDPSFGSFGGFFDNAGYAVVNLGGSLHAWTGVEFTARVQNLLDRGYEEAFGFPTLGRSVMAGIRVR
ncbi:MAG: TonB-dependent receptor [Acidobacteria bacterium]|nr:TonB-dependent receptor [Acidobacteriota bacterium]